MKQATRAAVLMLAVMGSLWLLHSASEGFVARDRFYVRPLAMDDQTVPLRDLGLEYFRFELLAPPGHKVTIWQEAYLRGERVDRLCYGEIVIPFAGESVERK